MGKVDGFRMFVGGLPQSVTTKEFESIFAEYHNLEKAYVIFDQETGRSKGFGFLTFSDRSSVIRILEEEAIIIKGVHVDIREMVSKANLKNRKKSEAKFKIFVGGIPKNYREPKLKSYFSYYGKVTKVKILREESSNQSKGFAFVEFANEKSVEKVLTQKQHRCGRNKLDCQPLQVQVKDDEKSNGTNSSNFQYYGNNILEGNQNSDVNNIRTGDQIWPSPLRLVDWLNTYKNQLKFNQPIFDLIYANSYLQSSQLTPGVFPEHLKDGSSSLINSITNQLINNALASVTHQSRIRCNQALNTHHQSNFKTPIHSGEVSDCVGRGNYVFNPVIKGIYGRFYKLRAAAEEEANLFKKNRDLLTTPNQIK